MGKNPAKLALTLGVIMILATACGSTSKSTDSHASSAPTTTSSDSAPAGSSSPSGSNLSGTLTISGWEFDQSARGKALWSAMQDFQKANPSVHLKLQQVARTNYENVINTQVGAKGGPDVMVLPNDLMPSLAHAALLQPLDNVLTSAEKSSLNASAKDGQIGGHLDAAPWAAVTYALFYNKQLFSQAGISQPPSDFQQFLDDAKQIKSKTGKYGFAFRTSLAEEAPWWNDFTNWTYGYGGSWSANGKLTIDTPANISGLAAFKAIFDSGAMDTTDDSSTFRQKFAQGQIGMEMDNQAALDSMMTSKGALPGSDLGSAPLPFPQRVPEGTFNFIAINKYAKNMNLASAFMAWLFTPSTQQILAAATAPDFAGTNVQVPQSFVSANPWINTYESQLPHAKGDVIAGFEAKTPQIRHIVLQAVVSATVGHADPKQAFQQAQSNAQAAGLAGS